MADTKIPEVLWAQRSSDQDASKNFIYLTISVPDISKEDIKLDLQPTSLKFEGKSQTLGHLYHVDLEFYAEIDPAASKVNHTSKNVEIKLQKKELKSEYWPRLLKESKKMHFLKTDFDKWVDEDEQEEAKDDVDFGGMSGLPGMSGLGGMNGMENFGDIDFSKLGGDSGGEDVGDDSDDEDDMPDLEDDNNVTSDAAAAETADAAETAKSEHGDVVEITEEDSLKA